MKMLDERFFAHRMRSTAYGGFAGAAMAGALLFYHYFAERTWSWDLFAVIAAMSLTKLAAMAWHYARH
jgi:hypothetical protein